MTIIWGVFYEWKCVFMCLCVGDRFCPKKYVGCRGSNVGYRSAWPLGIYQLCRLSMHCQPGGCAPPPPHSHPPHPPSLDTYSVKLAIGPSYCWVQKGVFVSCVQEKAQNSHGPRWEVETWFDLGTLMAAYQGYGRLGGKSYLI